MSMAVFGLKYNTVKHYLSDLLFLVWLKVRFSCQWKGFLATVIHCGSSLKYRKSKSIWEEKNMNNPETDSKEIDLSGLRT